MDLISVIVPVYKVEKYLDRCVQSIVDQTFTNLEIILVDDGSPDNCPAICDVWAEKDSRISVIHKKNGGLSDARNVGIAKATGEYIAFVDSDDWIHKDMYATLIAVQKRTSSDIVSCDIREVYDVCLETNETELDCKEYSAEHALSLLIEDSLKQVVWNKLYKKTVIDNILFPKGKYHEDEFWSYQVIGNAKKITVINYIGYYYFQRAESIMGSKYSIKRLDAIEAKVCRQEYIAEKYPALILKSKINLLFTILYHTQNVLVTLKGKEKNLVLQKLQRQVNKYTLSNEEKQSLSRKNRFWLSMAKVSIKITGRLRNMLKIGI